MILLGSGQREVVFTMLLLHLSSKTLHSASCVWDLQSLMLHCLEQLWNSQISEIEKISKAVPKTNNKRSQISLGHTLGMKCNIFDD